MRLFSALAMILIAVPALADQNWLSPDDFTAKVAGRATQIYMQDGTFYGTEYFLPKQRVIWQKADETRCYLGAWSARDDLVCFRYEGGFGSCIKYYMSADTLVSVDWVGDAPTATTYNLTVVNEAPPTCN